MKNYLRHGQRLGALVLVGVLGLVASATLAQGINSWTGNGVTNLWTDGGNWSDGVPAAGQAVVISGGTGAYLTEATAELASFSMTGGSLIFSDWLAPLQATNVTISGGTVTCASDFDESSPSNRVWIICEESFHLAKPGTIDVSGKGYTKGAGPGVGPTEGSYGVGGGHGGQGGFGYYRGGVAYGSLTAPVTPGSGGTSYTYPGGSGGGAVRIIAGDTVSINGTINAKGLTASFKNSGGGGAGGSIYITATHFTGNSDGLLTANGGAAGNPSYGGGGGGGRIAVDGGQIAAPLAVRFSTAPGLGDNDAYDAPVAIRPLEPHQAWTAGWGTLYIEDEALLSAMPQNNQFDRVVLRVGNATEWNVSQLTVTNNSFRMIPEGFQLNVAGDLTVGTNAHLGIEGSIACGGNLVLTNGARLSVFSCPAGDNDSVYGAFVDVTNDIVIAEGAWLQPNNQATNGASVRLRMRNLRIIGTTGGINAMARGYAPRHGLGKGGATGIYGGGGGYGGTGGVGRNGAAGSTYGNPYAPLAPGSGGGGSTGSGYGGGLVVVEAAKDVMINGQIIADGGIGTGHYLYGAGGAGGGILISCDRFLGTETALLSVKGGNSPVGDSGAGGGGRIAVWHKRMPAQLQDKLLSGITGNAIASTNNPASYLGQINIGIGTGGSRQAAQPGTVWFITPPPSGTMIIVR